MKKLTILDASEQQKFMTGYSFLTLVLELSVAMDVPVATVLEYARFSIRLCEGSEILSYVPDEKGVLATVTQSKERVIKVTPSLELVPAPTSKLGLGVEFSSKSGCTYQVPVFIEEVKGSIWDESTRVQWDIYGQQAAPMSFRRAGATSVVKAFLTIRLRKNTECDATVGVEGRVRRDLRWFFDVSGSVKLFGPEKIRIVKKKS